MDNSQYQHSILDTLIYMKALLRYRVKIINATGKQRQSDDIRDLTKRLHSYAIQILNDAIGSWDGLHISTRDLYLNKAREYTRVMLKEEGNALRKLAEIIKALGDKTPTVIRKAHEVHNDMIFMTHGLSSAFHWLQEQKPRNYRIPEGSEKVVISLVQKKLFDEREKLIQELTPRFPKQRSMISV